MLCAWPCGCLLARDHHEGLIGTENSSSHLLLLSSPLADPDALPMLSFILWILFPDFLFDFVLSSPIKTLLGSPV